MAYFLRLFLFILVGYSFPVGAQPSNDVGNLVAKYREQMPEYGDLCPIILFCHESLIPMRFEVELAKKSMLSLQEIVALSREFSRDYRFDGSLGVWIESPSEVGIDPNINILQAYRFFTRVRSLRSFSVSDLERLRMIAFKEARIYDPNLKTSRKIPKFASDGKKNNFRDKKTDITPAAIERLRKYGHTVHETSTEYIIDYDESKLKENLAHYVEELNRLIEEKKPWEEVVAFAVQELLLIHPFDNGNGRTARLLGQIIIFHLKGAPALLPPEFREELKYTQEELVQALKNQTRPIDTDPSIRNTYSEIFKRYQGRFGPSITVPAPHGKESSLPEKILWETDEQATGSFDPRVYKSSANLYFGDSYKSPDVEMDWKDPVKRKVLFESAAKNMFVFGRQTRGVPHFNVAKHLASTSTKAYGPSGFFPSSLSWQVAKGFSNTFFSWNTKSVDGIGVVYALDFRSAPIIDSPALAFEWKKMHGFMNELEIFIPLSLAPTRVIGGEMCFGVECLFIFNPNYQPEILPTSELAFNLPSFKNPLIWVGEMLRLIKIADTKEKLQMLLNEAHKHQETFNILATHGEVLWRSLWNRSLEMGFFYSLNDTVKFLPEKPSIELFNTYIRYITEDGLIKTYKEYLNFLNIFKRRQPETKITTDPWNGGTRELPEELKPYQELMGGFFFAGFGQLETDFVKMAFNIPESKDISKRIEIIRRLSEIKPTKTMEILYRFINELIQNDTIRNIDDLLKEITAYESSFDIPNMKAELIFSLFNNDSWGGMNQISSISKIGITNISDIQRLSTAAQLNSIQYMDLVVISVQTIDITIDEMAHFIEKNLLSEEYLNAGNDRMSQLTKIKSCMFTFEYKLFENHELQEKWKAISQPFSQRVQTLMDLETKCEDFLATSWGW